LKKNTLPFFSIQAVAKTVRKKREQNTVESKDVYNDNANG